MPIKFNSVKRGGYDPNEVDLFVHQLISILNESPNDIFGLSSTNPEDPESAAQRLLSAAQRTADQIIRDAKEQTSQLLASAEAQADNAAGSIPMPTDPAPASVSEPLSEGVAEDTAAADLAGVQVEDERTWNDETTLTLAPGEAAEVKLVMNAGDAATYEWTVSAGHLNSDLHGDGRGGQSISYRKGRSEASDSGELTAAFDGSHGWFWRNRSDVAVTVTLHTRGEYSAFNRLF